MWTANLPSRIKQKLDMHAQTYGNNAHIHTQTHTDTRIF